MFDLKTKYDHDEVERGRYEKWLNEKIYEAKDGRNKPYTIVIPPPNVTGILHIGHAFDFSLQDIITRRKRMQGYDTLYLPGMDHAGIATQAKVDQKLKNQGISRYDIGREKFLEVAWDWKTEYAKTIRSQWAALGLGLDYSRERFTLDDNLNKSVIKVFKTLYDEGLIYHGKRMINWDTEAKTALSDIEIEHKDTNGALYHIAYPLMDNSGEIIVATTRPETMFADQAVMVHPKDERYKDVIGKKVLLPLTGRYIPVISDDYVDMTFGTGAVKVTPAHDPNDYEVGKRHNLDMPECIDEEGKITEMGGKYAHMDRFECRKELVKELEEKGFIRKIEPIIHSCGYSERTGSLVEPRISAQWFVKMKPLAERSLKDSHINWVPERFENTFRQWMENIEDWCISRQLWWGHRIPVYYRGDEIYCGEKPEGEGWVQDEDVLDTWFSSALWPFSTLDWYNNSEDFQNRFPTDTLVTGYDIIFFWVSRMIFQSLKFTDKDPFKNVVIHGLIRDSQGRKMSKSLGNGVDPIKEIEKYGADTLRYFLTTTGTLGQDLNYDDEKVKASWNYLNKVWNVGRYVLNTVDGIDFNDLSLKEEDLNILDKWILTKENDMVKACDDAYERFDFNNASKAIYDFLYDDFASIYLELSKIDPSRLTTKKILLRELLTILKLLAPITPFITDYLYTLIYPNEKSIHVSSWPEVDNLIYRCEKEEMDMVIDLIKKVRTIRNEYGVSLSKPIELDIVSLDKEAFNTLNFTKEYLNKFLNPNPLNILDKDINPLNSETVISNRYKLYIPMGELVNVDEKMKSLNDALAKCEAEIKRSNSILSNENFLKKAPEAKVNIEKEKLQGYLKTKKELEEEIAKVQCLKN
ncbi:MAG: valine--tRNA ligase [Gammaproteobacteria bacterium]|nr:valine--tRNA ligase [Gammaproteobacteria bacterium]